ncbi:hypothetical protein D3C81_2206770 [compost metagenome]
MAYFDAFRFIQLISPRPLLMIIGAQAITSWMSIEAIEDALEPKGLFRIDGASHVDLYDKEEYVAPAVLKLTEFFRTSL